MYFLPFCQFLVLLTEFRVIQCLSGCLLTAPRIELCHKAEPDLSPRVRDYFGKWQGMMMGKTLTLSVLLSWSPLWATWAWSHWDPQRSRVDRLCLELLPPSVSQVGADSLPLTLLIKGCFLQGVVVRVTATHRVRPWGRNEETRGVVLLAGMFPCDSCVKIVAIAMGGQSS